MKKFLKPFLGILMGAFILTTVFAAVVPRNNSKLDISQKRMLFTHDGSPSGNCVMDINSGGNIVACAPLLNGSGNQYITNASFAGYIPRIKTGYYYQQLPSAYIEDDGGQIQIKGTDVRIVSSPSSNSMAVSDDYMKITINTGEMRIIDNRSTGYGVVYYNDYSSGFVARSLVDKAYVDAKFGNYLSGNYATFVNGFTQRYGSGIAWDDVIPETYFGTISNQQPVQVIMSGSLIALQCFDDLGVTEWFGRFEKPHDSTLTGYIYPHLHRMGDATENTTGVIFMQYSFVEHGKQPSTPVTITGYMNQGVVAWSGRLENIDGAIYDSGVALGGAMVFRMWRDSTFAGDTYVGNMCIEQIGLHYASDRRGSRTPSSY